MCKKFFFLIFLFCCFLQATSAEKFHVGTNAEFPPYTFIENGEIVGFDIDVAREVARRLQREILFKDMSFDALIPALALNQVDFVAAGMSYTEERGKRVLFTSSYIAEDPLVIFAKAQKKFTGIDDLNDHTVVVVEGFTADLLMSSKKKIRLIRLPTQADAFLAVKSGRADAFITAKSTVDSFYAVQDASPYRITPIPGTAETCALMIPKNRPELLKVIQEALDKMESDGTLAQLKAKWKLS